MEDIIINIGNLSINEVNTILVGLSELPAKISMELITKIKNDVDYQINDYKIKNKNEPT